jgi:hypothetical protein
VPETNGADLGAQGSSGTTDELHRIASDSSPPPDPAANIGHYALGVM